MPRWSPTTLWAVNHGLPMMRFLTYRTGKVLGSGIDETRARRRQMRRREFILACGATLVPRDARAQQPTGKIIRIGYLGAASASEGARGAKAFETGLRDLGDVEGKSVA